MFSKNFQRKYALTDQGMWNTKKGTFWTVIANLVVMGGMGILYLLMADFMSTLTDGQPLPSAALFIGLAGMFVILSFVTHLQPYSVIMRLGVATTILVGADLILSGQIDFMMLFLFLLIITRVYAPFDQSLALIAEMFVSQVSANRMNEIYDAPIA